MVHPHPLDSGAGGGGTSNAVSVPASIAPVSATAESIAGASTTASVPASVGVVAHAGAAYPPLVAASSAVEFNHAAHASRRV